MVLDLLGRLAQLLPVGEFGDRAGPLGPDRVRGMRQVGPQLGIGHRGPGRDRERRHAEVGRHLPPGAVTWPSSVRARISARCMTATPDRCRVQRAADVHQARVVRRAQHLGPAAADRRHLVRADRRRHVGVLHRERAAEPAALLGVRQVGQVQAPHRAQQPQRGIPHLEHPQRVTARVVGHPVREVRAHIGHPQHVGQEHGKLIGPWHDLGHRPGQARIPRLRGQRRVVLPDHRGARGRRGHHRLEAAEGSGEPARHRHRLPPVTGVEMHLAAAGLGRREIHLMAQPLQHRDHSLAGVREQRVGQARDEQADSHQAASARHAIRRAPAGTRPPDTSDLPARSGLRSAQVREQRRTIPGPHRLAAADNRERRHVPGGRVQVEQGHVPRGPRIGPGHQPGRPGVRGHDDVAERGAQAIAGGLGHGFLPGPRDQEGAGPAAGRDRGQRRLLGRGQHEAGERLRIAVAAQQARALVELLDVHADGSSRHGQGDQVARVRDRMLDAAALDDRLAVRLAALAAGPVEAHVRRALAGVPREHRLGQRASGQEPLAVLRAPVGRPAPPLGLVEQPGEPVRGVLPAGPPDVSGPVRQRVPARQFSHAVSLTAG